MDKVSQKFFKAIRDFDLIGEGDKVLVALSGGADSTLLLFLLKEFSNLLGIKRLKAVHINHLIRETAFRDEEICKELSQRLGVELEIRRFDVKKYAKVKGLSLEEAGREVRYKILEEIREREGFTKIATAHHADDLIETQLLFYSRGSGLEGLEGFPPKAGVVIRPLYYLTKGEIYEAVKRLGLPYAEDETNRDVNIPRNRIRHNVVPQLRVINPSLEDSALRLAEILREENLFWEKHTQKLLREIVEGNVLNLKRFRDLTVAEQRRVLKKLFPQRGFEFVEALRRFALSEKPRMELAGIYFHKEGNFLKISNPPEGVKPYSYFLPLGGEVYVEEAGYLLRCRVVKLRSVEELINKPKNVEYFQFESPPEGFIVRNRRKGDRFVPFGRKKEVKLKDFLIKEKIPFHLRDKIPLLTLANQILWIVGVRRGNFFAVKDLNKEVVEVVYEQSN